MLETLLESLDKDVFSAEMVEALVVQFNEAVETKAKEIADAGLTEAIETAVNEALFISEPTSTSYVCTFAFETYITIKHTIYTSTIPNIIAAAFGFLLYLTTFFPAMINLIISALYLC